MTELPPSLQIEIAPPPVDRRPEYIGAEEAAEVLGLGRTQVWRLATKCRLLRYEIFGAEEGRKQYKFRREDVLALRDKREAQRQLREAHRSRKPQRQASTQEVARLVACGQLSTWQAMEILNRHPQRI